MKFGLLKSQYTRVMSAALINLLLSLVLFTIGRVVYWAVNYSLFLPMNSSDVAGILQGGLVFDLSAMAYINILYIVLMLLPLHFKEGAIYQKVTKWIFLVLNGIALAGNMADSVYFPFTKRRTTSSVFSEFSNDSTIYKVIVDETLSRWYLVVIFAVVMWAAWRLYRTPKSDEKPINYKFYYPLQLVYLVVGLLLSVCAIRGGIGADVRPITLSNACQYVDNQNHTELVLNTPFAFIRTLGKKSFVVRDYFATEAELEAEFNPVHQPIEGRQARAKNVVILIMESFGKEYIGALNPGSGHPSYTPFLDSLIGHSLTFSRSYANGHKSIDAMPSVLSSIPMFVEAFVLTSAALNVVSGVGGELSKEGFGTSFFHGASNGSMGFMAFAKATGFEEYYGRTEYDNDADFDGRWAIWDEEFLGYYASELAGFEEPFASVVFTASSHHPFKVPERYEGRFDEGTIPIHKCIGYSDNALRHFFAEASKWDNFEDTLFVITADHTNQTAYPAEMNSVETFSVPIIFYQAGSELKGCRQTIAQQIDIMPTVLGYLGYDKPYVAFGRDLLSTPDSEGCAVNYLAGVYQLLQGDYVLRYDGEQAIALYNYREDRMMQRNLLGTGLAQEQKMVVRLEAILQQYMNRMVEDRLIIEN